jgi:hypothetical protein
MASSDVFPFLEAAPMKRRRPQQDLQKALADHLRLRAAPGTYWFYPRTATEGASIRGDKIYGLELKADEMRTADAEVTVALEIDAPLAQLETWGLLRGRSQ